MNEAKDFNLDEIINEGLKLKKEVELLKQEEAKKQIKKQQDEFDSAIKYWREKLSKNDFLKNLIVEATANGLKSAIIGDGADHACAHVLNTEYKGIRSFVEYGKYRPADDCDEIEYTYVRIYWN